MSETKNDETILGRHVILDLYGCTNTDLLDDEQGMQKLFHDTAEALKCTIVNEVFHRFSPQGVSGVVVIAESHLSVHTWPELGYAAVDLYTCGDFSLLDNLPKMLQDALGAEHYDYQNLQRGHVDREPDHRRQPTLVLNPRGLSEDMKWLTDAWAEQVLWTVQVKEVLRDVKTEHQRIQIVDTERLGRMLVVDGNIQCAEADEASYHEFITHTALCRSGAPSPKDGRRVLVIGGGDGGAAREAMRHNDVVAVDIVDIDDDVIRACRDHMPGLWRHPDGRRSLDEDERLSVHIADALDWLKTVARDGGPEGYDLIVVDGAEPVGPGQRLYTDEFYGLVKRALREGGAICVQAGSFWYQPDVLRTVYHGLKRVFPVVKPMECFTATFPGGVWNLAIATLGDDPEKLNRARAEGLDDLQWYSAAGHRSCFGIPPRAWEVLEKAPPSLDAISARLGELKG
jgi:spermidine synthase